jgi:hypothetical protein
MTNAWVLPMRFFHGLKTIFGGNRRCEAAKQAENSNLVVKIQIFLALKR